MRVTEVRKFLNSPIEDQHYLMKRRLLMESRFGKTLSGLCDETLTKKSVGVPY